MIGPAIVGRGEFAAGLIGLLMVWVVASVLLYYYEGKLNEEYSTLQAAMLSTFQDLFPYSDEPLTNTGQHYWKICKGIALFICGGMLLPSIQKSVWPKWSKRVTEWLLGLGQTGAAGTATSSGSDHWVIINRSPRTEELIRNLQCAGGAHSKPIVVVSERPVEFSSGPEYAGVRALQGDPTSEECLRKARVAEARSVTIVSAWPAPDPTDRRKHLRGDVADARTIQVLCSIRALCGAGGNTEIVAELKSRKNVPTAQQAAHGAPIRIICEEALRPPGS